MIRPGSPFFQLYADLKKSQDNAPRYEVELHPKAEKLLRKMGAEEQGRAKKIMARVHGHPVDQPHPMMDRMNENQHNQTGLDWSKRNGYTLGDYRIRLMASLEGNKMTVFHVGTRESSKHTGRTAR